MCEGPDAKNEISPKVSSMLVWLRLAVSLVGLVVFVVAWFAISGRVTWVQGWALIVAFVGYVGALVWRLSSVDPELMHERQRCAGRKPHPFKKLVKIRVIRGKKLTVW